MMAAESTRAVKVVYCYAREDQELRDELEKHLGPLRHTGQIISWHDRKIEPGAEWEREIHTRLNTATLILLLVSPNFMNSQYCYGKEMRRALERYEAGEARVIPIILRPVDWKETPLGKLQALPTDGKPITRWRNRDDAFEDVTKGIRVVVAALLAQKTKEQWMAEGNTQTQASRFDEALAAYAQALLLDPNDATIYRSKGKVLEALKRYDEALTAYEQALRLDPNDADVYLVKGVLLQGLQRYEEALAAYEQTIRLDPDDVPRLFNQVVPPLLKQLSEDKQYMENIFASIDNAVITTDASGLIKVFNKAAGDMLKLDPKAVIGKHFEEAFQERPQLGLSELLRDAITQHAHITIVPRSVECEIPGRGPVNLTFYISPLRDVSSRRDVNGEYIGTVVIIGDTTELKRAEAQTKQIHRIFERYVHPSIVQQLIKDPRALNLGGETREVSVIFADIRGYTHLHESIAPHEMMNIVNHYLSMMYEAIWDEGGTLAPFFGSSLMALFNAPLSQKDHALRAVRAAWKMHEAVLTSQRAFPQVLPVSFGIGINTGLATVGNVGSQKRMQSYTAIGDAVDWAFRLQTDTADNSILLAESTYFQARLAIEVEGPFMLAVKNRAAPFRVYRLKGLR